MAVFLTFILLPRLKALGPTIKRPVLKSLIRIIPPVTSVLLLWDWVIFIGLVLTGLAVIVGFGALPPITMRYEKLYRIIEERDPTPDESRQLDSLTRRPTVRCWRAANREHEGMGLILRYRYRGGYYGFSPLRVIAGLLRCYYYSFLFVCQHDDGGM